MVRNRKEQRIVRAAKRKKRNTIIIGGVLVFLMTFGIVGFGSNSSNNGSSSSNFVYNGFDFHVQQGQNGNIVFVASKDNQEIGYFYNQPIDTEDINLTEELIDDLITKNSFVFSSKPLPLDGSAGNDAVYKNILIQQTQSLSGKNIIRGSTENSYFNDDPFYDCESVTVDRPVIIINEGTDGLVVKNTDTVHCYEVFASGLDLLKFRDKIIYTMLGIQ